MLSACTLASLGESLTSNSERSIKCISLNNQQSQARLTLVHINCDETFYHPFYVTVNKYGETCNTIDDPYAQFCVPNKFQNMNAKVFDLISGVNETRFLVGV